MGTAAVIPHSCTRAAPQLLTKFPRSGPRRMAGREGEGTSGTGLPGMRGAQRADPGGRGAASPSLTEPGGRGAPDDRGCLPQPGAGTMVAGREPAAGSEAEGPPCARPVPVPGRARRACPPRPGRGGSGPPHRAARPSPPCAPDVTPRRGERGGGRDGRRRPGARVLGAAGGPLTCGRHPRRLQGEDPVAAFRRPPQTAPAPTRVPPSPRPNRPAPWGARASQYRDVDEGFPGDGGPDGGRVLIAHDGRVLTGPVRHEVVDVGVPPGHGAATGAALGAAAGAAGWARGPRAGGRGEAESSGHALPSGPRLC